MNDDYYYLSVTYRVPGSGGVINRVKDSARRILPTGLYARLRDAALPVLATKGVPRLTDTLQEMPDVVAFVDAFYAADIALHGAVQAGDVPHQVPEMAGESL